MTHIHAGCHGYQIMLSKKIGLIYLQLTRGQFVQWQIMLRSGMQLAAATGAAFFLLIKW